MFLFARRWNSYYEKDVFHHFVLFHTYFTASLISSVGLHHNITSGLYLPVLLYARRWKSIFNSTWV